MTTRLTIETDARTELQETTPGFWVATELHNWFDDANSEIAIKTMQEATSALTLVASTESYTLPADFYLARRVEIQTQAGSSYWDEMRPLSLDYRQPADLVSSGLFNGPPYGYYIFGNKIYFVPVPDKAYSGTLFYFKNATKSSSDSDTPSYPEGVATQRVDTAIKLYICAMALRKRQDGSYTTYANDYNAAVAAMAADAAERGSAAPLIVQDDWVSE